MSTTQTQTEQRRGRRIAAAAGIVALVGICLGAAWALTGKDKMVATTAPTQTVSKEALITAADARVFFGHQSVGANLVDGIPAVYQDAGVAAPTITTELEKGSDGFFAHAYLGQNTDPVGKIADFDRIMRSGTADELDVAAMKLCWVDFNSSTDVDVVFADYQKTVDALARDYPDVAFLHVTTPVVAESTGAKAWLKRLVGKDTVAAENAVRERYNALMRQAYGDTGRLFDLAHLQSTAPDGTHVGGEYEGSAYLAMAPEWASDPGHLNAAGSQMVAAALLELIARQPSV